MERKQLKETEINKIIYDISKGLVKWYQFEAGENALYVGENKAIYEALQECGLNVMSVDTEELKSESWTNNHKEEFKYVVIVEAFEMEESPEYIIDSISKVISSDGKMLLGMNNRLGIKYFCGDKDKYTNNIFDGIENYRRAYVKNSDRFTGKCYSKNEMIKLLEKSGFEERNMRFYSVFPDLLHPQVMYAEDYLPNENLNRRLFPQYNNPSTVFLEEEQIYDSLIRNDMFHQMANAYLIEVVKIGNNSDVTHVTASIDRGKEKALYTIIHGEEYVEKKAIYDEGKKQLHKLYNNQKDLIAHGIKVVEGELKENSYVMPYIKAITAQEYFSILLEEDKSKFFEDWDRLFEIIAKSFEIAKEDDGDGKGAILKKGYPDMALINCFYIDGEFVFFDQEFVIENCDLNMILYRIIMGFFLYDQKMQKNITMQDMYKRYNLDTYLELWQKQENEFIDSVRNDHDLRFYHRDNRADKGVIFSNRQRMNYSQEEYQRRFVDIFKDVDSKKFIIFGSGKFAKQFISVYGSDCDIEAIVDNNENRQGEVLEGIKIYGPNILKEFDNSKYKVLICIKDFTFVAKQLENMGILDYAIYDSTKDYPRKLKEIKDTDDNHNKKYHIGYVAGVFDMFHVGHLNLLKKAKEQCEYLIVGIVPDEEVIKQKNKAPIIPIEDRVEIVKSCRYVNQVEALPVGYLGIKEAYKMFHFDVQFSGNDHDDNPDWESDINFLRERGSDLVFFDYTSKVSSTKLREDISK